MDAQVQALLNQYAAKIRSLGRELGETKATLQGFIQSCGEQPRSITEEIDSIPGRRIEYRLSGNLAFTAADNGLRGQPISMLVSQDGPWVMTHYPVVTWRPNAPAGATNFGQWSAVYSWPVPTQDRANRDYIDLSWELIDQGSQRNLQNLPSAPMFSRSDGAAVPLPVPTLFSPNSTVAFVPTFENISFNQAPQTPATGGLLLVTLLGYRVVNL